MPTDDLPAPPRPSFAASTHRTASFSRFVEGSMNDRVSNVPPATFLGGADADAVERLAATSGPDLPAADVEAAVVAKEAEVGRPLTTSQYDAVVAVCSSGRSVDLVVGVAGSGKTPHSTPPPPPWKEPDTGSSAPRPAARPPGPSAPRPTSRAGPRPRCCGASTTT